jgi:glycosyltransferase involved in cell wall biosynthesis
MASIVYKVLMYKRKILLCNEASFLNSGYANYGKQILHRLHSTGKYELAELACYGTVDDPRAESVPWKYYANSIDSNDSRYNKYTSSPLNQFGHWRFDLVCLDFKPDIVFDVRDPWMFDYQASSPQRKFFKWVIMPALDSVPQKIDWLCTFNTADILVPYTEWAKNYLSHYTNLWHHTTPAGIDETIFKPSDNLKTKFGLPKDSFIIGSVMRNQRRKLIPGLFEVIRKVKDTYPNIILYLHTTFPEISGWNIPSLLIEFGLANSVYFTYKCKMCKHFFPAKFSGPQTFCKKCGEFACTMSSTMNGISDNEMSIIYNMFDIYIQYAICEGFGMPQIEASACSVPVMSVDYSAMSEVVRNVDGFPIPLSSLSYEIENHAKRAYPDIDATAKLLSEYIESSPEYKETKKLNARNKTVEHYNWNNISKVWEEIFDNIDLSDKADWYTEPQFQLESKIQIDTSLNNYDIIEYICNKVLHDPNLMKTNFIQTTLLEMDYGIQKLNSKVLPYNRSMALEKLEKYANTKAFLDKLRVSKERLVEDYILKANRAKN